MASAKFFKHWTEQGPDFKSLKSLPSGTVRLGRKLPCGFGACGGISAQATVPRNSTSESKRNRPIVSISTYAFRQARKRVCGHLVSDRLSGATRSDISSSETASKKWANAL